MLRRRQIAASSAAAVRHPTARGTTAESRPSAQVTQGQRGGQRGAGGLGTLVLRGGRKPGPVQRLFLGVGRQDTVGNRRRRVQRNACETLSYRIADVLEMRCRTTD